MNRAAFRINTFEEADNNIAYWLARPPAERLAAATYLIRQAWNISPEDPAKLDRNVTKIRRRSMSNNYFNQDFQDFINALNNQRVEYILVGGYAVILHGYNRTTGDMDIWVNPSSENYQRIVKAFAEFGMPVFDMTEQKFLQTEEFDVFSFGVSPTSIDLMTSVKGLDFAAAYPNSTVYEFDDLSIRVIMYDDLLRAKKAAGRNKDLNDIEQLKRKK